jgi:hypothetical protein
MMQTTKVLIESIVQYLVILRRPVVSALQKKVDRTEVNKIFSTLGLIAPQGLLEMFESYNGTKVDEGDDLDSLHFFPGFYWMSVEDSVNSYLACCKYDLWDKSWFPLFSNGGGDFYCVICDKKSDNYGEIVGFIYGESSSDIEFSSLPAMLTVVRECFSRNIYYLENGYLEANDNAVIEVAREFCPELDLYK